MKMRLKKTHKYAIALQGGGARGGYEIGVWKALDEAGITYEAVSGTSVGALNGALFAMGDLSKAIDVWSNLEFSDVIAAPEGNENELHRLVSGQLEFHEIRKLAPGMVKEIIRNGGLDVSPLRQWIKEVVNPEKIRQSGVRLFATTVDISDKKGLTIEISSLEDDEQVTDMLLASAYHPTFKLERLGGKLYTDGGFIDSLPLTPLIENGYKEIIAVHIPGIGYDRKDYIPDDVNIYHVEPSENLGRTLNFDKEQAIRDMQIGYLDGKRMLYDLKGFKYYIDKSLTQEEALRMLLVYFGRAERTKIRRLRELCEEKIPAAAQKLGQKNGDYYDILIALAEESALAANMDRYVIYQDREFVRQTLNI